MPSALARKFDAAYRYCRGAVVGAFSARRRKSRILHKRFLIQWGQSRIVFTSSKGVPLVTGDLLSRGWGGYA